MKKAFLSGINGQDGSYLAELLLEKGYEVHGMIRKSSVFNTQRIEHLINYDYKKNDGAKRFFIHYGDLIDGASLTRLLRRIAPDEVYNLGAQSHVKVSFDIPLYTGDVVALGTVRILDAIMDIGSKIKFYQASSSEIFGEQSFSYQNEQTPLAPASPYACAKAFSYWMTIIYRKSYNLFACNGILFNHESPRRHETFVTRKITRAIARILKGEQDILYLGNLDAKRDWGYAKEYVYAIWLALQQDQPDDYVIATGENYSVRDFLDESFSLVGLDWKKYVQIDPRLYRPNEVSSLCGDAKKAREKLNWKPKCSFRQLVRLMLESDLNLEGLNLKDFEN
ncbi:MAG: GDP-mannose 4,6-dehydratase [Bacteriovoracales bacterium]|nr:GDP-mannose 4,6-dehydratase [Bacteriovoracales bacterium]